MALCSGHKGLLTGIGAAIVLCLYLVTVTGFDVHSCGDNGRVYIEPLFAGISCSSIHPETPCHHHGHDCCKGDEECCSDRIAILSITGDGSDCQFYLPLSEIVEAVLPACLIVPEQHSVRWTPENDYSPPPLHCQEPAFLCVLRV